MGATLSGCGASRNQVAKAGKRSRWLTRTSDGPERDVTLLAILQVTNILAYLGRVLPYIEACRPDQTSMVRLGLCLRSDLLILLELFLASLATALLEIFVSENFRVYYCPKSITSLAAAE